MKLKAMRDEILIRRIVEEHTQSGIYVPDMQRCMKGEVLSVGPNVTRHGKQVPAEVEEGQVVIFPKGTGQNVTGENETLLMLKHTDVLGIIG